MQPYDHGGNVYGGPRPRVDFSVNVNPLGMPPQVVEALSPDPAADARYPDPACRALRQALSIRFSIPTKNILCGNGSADLLMRICAALRPKNALLPAPTFSEYARCVRLFGGTVKEYPLSENDGFAITESFLQAVTPDTDMVFLCHPNNPTGLLIPPKLLDKTLSLCEISGIRLFLDACFLDLTEAPSNLSSFLKTHPGLFILKAITKSFALPGVRIGYCLSSDSALLTAMARSVQPWNVSVFAQEAVPAALLETDHLADSVRYIERERAYLTEALTGLGFSVCPSDANFILFRGPERLDTALRAQGIAIRNCGNFPGLGPGWYRISVRIHDDNEILIRSIRQIIDKGDSWQRIS